MHKTVPVPVKHETRICFSIAWFDSEKDAALYDKHVRKLGLTYNGGWFHGMSCGRDKTWDHVDKTTGRKLFAVTD
jgi:hypothetical protein